MNNLYVFFYFLLRLSEIHRYLPKSISWKNRCTGAMYNAKFKWNWKATFKIDFAIEKSDIVAIKVQEELSCSICYNILNEPKVLDCQHVYCLEVLTTGLASRLRLNALNVVKLLPSLREDWQTWNPFRVWKAWL